MKFITSAIHWWTQRGDIAFYATFAPVAFFRPMSALHNLLDLERNKTLGIARALLTARDRAVALEGLPRIIVRACLDVKRTCACGIAPLRQTHGTADIRCNTDTLEDTRVLCRTSLRFGGEPRIQMATTLLTFMHTTLVSTTTHNVARCYS